MNKKGFVVFCLCILLVIPVSAQKYALSFDVYTPVVAGMLRTLTTSMLVEDSPLVLGGGLGFEFATLRKISLKAEGSVLSVFYEENSFERISFVFIASLEARYYPWRQALYGFYFNFGYKFYGGNLESNSLKEKIHVDKYAFSGIGYKIVFKSKNTTKFFLEPTLRFDFINPKNIELIENLWNPMQSRVVFNVALGIVF